MAEKVDWCLKKILKNGFSKMKSSEINRSIHPAL